MDDSKARPLRRHASLTLRMGWPRGAAVARSQCTTWDACSALSTWHTIAVLAYATPTGALGQARAVAVLYAGPACATGRHDPGYGARMADAGSPCHAAAPAVCMAMTPGRPMTRRTAACRWAGASALWPAAARDCMATEWHSRIRVHRMGRGAYWDWYSLAVVGSSCTAQEHTERHSHSPQERERRWDVLHADTMPGWRSPGNLSCEDIWLTSAIHRAHQHIAAQHHFAFFSEPERRTPGTDVDAHMTGQETKARNRHSVASWQRRQSAGQQRHSQQMEMPSAKV